MKSYLFSTVAAGLVFTTGCSKNEEEPTAETAPKSALLERAQEASTQLSERVATIKKPSIELQRKVKDVITLMDVTPEEIYAELDLPIDEIKSNVAAYTPSELISRTQVYKDLFLKYKDKYDTLGNQVKSMPIGNAFTNEGRAIQAKLAEYTKKLTRLNERYNLYMDKIKSLNIDYRAFDLL